jgi:hypothetical protein
VTPARAHRSVAGIRFASVFAASASAASASSTAAASRPARQARTAASARRSASGSTVWIALSISDKSGFGSVSVNRFTPTTTSTPDSIRPRRSASALTSCDFR